MRSTDYKALSHAVFSSPLLPRPLRPKYSTEPPILKHPKPMFLLQYERPGFTPTHNNRQNYSYVYLNLHIFGKQTCAGTT